MKSRQSFNDNTFPILKVKTSIPYPNPSANPSNKPMKSKFNILATIALSIQYAHAAPITWADIGGNTNWNTGSSWVDGVAPANTSLDTGDVAIFTSVTNAQPNLTTGTRSVFGIDFQLPEGGLNFTSAAGALLRLGSTGIDATTQLSGESTVSVEKLQINGASHQWTLFSNTSNSSTSTFSVSSDIELSTNLTVRSDRNSAANNVGIVNLGGDISETGGIRNLTLSSASAVRNTINLTGNSSYSGTTTIQQVTVTANSLANASENSALGNAGDIILGSNASVANLTFQDLNVDGSTDRLLLLKGTLGTQPYVLANNDADNTIAFTNPGNTGDTVGSYANNLIFALGGTNTGNNTFGQIINDRTGGGITILRKADSGTWVLTNSNSYTGGTEVNGGLLRINNTGALGGGNLAFNGSGVLGLAAGDMTTRTVGTGADQVTWAGSGGFAAFGAERTVSFGTPGTSINWTAANFIGASRVLVLGHVTADATLKWDQTTNLAGGTRTVQVNDGSAAIDAKITRSINGGSSGTALNVLNKSGAGTLALTANSFYFGNTTVSAGTLMIGAGGTTGGVSTNSPNIIVASGATLAVNRTNTLTQGTANLIAAISGDGGFAQVGSGTTEFTLANIYTGPTTIAAGTLKLNASDVLPDTSAISIGSATLNTADGVAETTGTLAVTGTATINLGTAATLVFTDSNLEDWTGGTLNITGDFTNTSIKFATSGGLDAGQLAVISVNGSGAGTFTLDPSGYLVPGGSSPYDTWATGDEPFDGDANGDGVQDGLAFLLGAETPGINAANLLPTVTQSGGNLVLSFNCLPVSARGGATLKVDHSPNLAGWTATANVVPDETNAIPDNNVTFEVEAGPEGPPALNSVTATIGSAAAAGGDQLFGRLKAENP